MDYTVMDLKSRIIYWENLLLPLKTYVSQLTFRIEETSKMMLKLSWWQWKTFQTKTYGQKADLNEVVFLYII